MKTLYTAEALATGEGRDGHGRTSDGKLDLDLAIPKEMGGSGNGTNPEQLFAIGYAACYHMRSCQSGLMMPSKMWRMMWRWSSV